MSLPQDMDHVDRWVTKITTFTNELNKMEKVMEAIRYVYSNGRILVWWIAILSLCTDYRAVGGSFRLKVGRRRSGVRKRLTSRLKGNVGYRRLIGTKHKQVSAKNKFLSEWRMNSVL